MHPDEYSLSVRRTGLVRLPIESAWNWMKHTSSCGGTVHAGPHRKIKVLLTMDSWGWIRGLVSWRKCIDKNGGNVVYSVYMKFCFKLQQSYFDTLHRIFLMTFVPADLQKRWCSFQIQWHLDLLTLWNTAAELLTTYNSFSLSKKLCYWLLFVGYSTWAHGIPRDPQLPTTYKYDM